jgi:hypothetical protein
MANKILGDKVFLGSKTCRTILPEKKLYLLLQGLLYKKQSNEK